jgi:hypothetical protein
MRMYNRGGGGGITYLTQAYRGTKERGGESIKKGGNPGGGEACRDPIEKDSLKANFF